MLEECFLEGDSISERTGKDNAICVILRYPIMMIFKVPVQLYDALPLMAVFYLVSLAFYQWKGDEDVSNGREFQSVGLEEGEIVYFFVSQGGTHFGQSHELLIDFFNIYLHNKNLIIKSEYIVNIEFGLLLWYL